MKILQGKIYILIISSKPFAAPNGGGLHDMKTVK